MSALRLPPGGLWLPAVPAQARSFLFHDGVVDVPEVGASAPFGMGLVLVVAVLRQARTLPSFLHDGVVHMPQVGAAAPFGMMLVLGVFVDSHRPHPSSGGTPTVVRDRPKRTLGTILPPGRSRANLLLG